MAKVWVLSAFLFSGLRRLSYRTPMRAECMRKHRVARGKYKCNMCQNIVSRKQIAVDHVLPVIDPNTGFQDWDTYIARLFVEKEGLQVLCKTCHSTKSKEENKIRRQRAKNAKQLS